MNITTDLVRIVQEAHSLPRILDAATLVIVERMSADSCFVFLVDERGRLAQRGGNHGAHVQVDERTGLEAAVVALRAITEKSSLASSGGGASLLASPLLLRDFVVGAVVLHRPAGREFSAAEIGSLALICAQLAGIIETARIIDALDRGERPVPLVAPRLAAHEPNDGEMVLHGIGASPGVAIGSVVFRGAYRLDLSARDLPAGEPDAERARVRIAIEKTRNDVLRIQVAAAREVDEEHALIFAYHLLLLQDPMLLARIDREIVSGLSAPLAIDTALGEFEARLRLVPDAYIQERVDDLDDVRNRLVDHVLDSGTRVRLGVGIVVTSRVPPSLVIELKTEGAQALVTESGGTTSHGVLLARALGIPVVTGIVDATSVRLGDRMVVDGTTGVVVVRPSEATAAQYQNARRLAERARTEYAKFRDVLARTADGVRVVLHANVGVASDLIVAQENGAEGVGLYRTEFPFIVRDSFPTRTEQVKIYGKAHAHFPNGPINFRLLDLGGDKFLTGGAMSASRSAFHGYRSIRVLFDHPDVLRDQVQALALAAAGRPFRILIPMVTSLEELRRLKVSIHQALASIDGPFAAREPEIGVMIEVPAAVELAADIAKEADFLSIGTNDLMQYTLVVDREDSRMAAMSDPYHPAILRMISRVVSAARAAGKSVSICGEIAVRPDVALALMAIGVDSLSVVPSAIPELKQALARARLEPMRRALDGILALSDARSIAHALREAQFA